MENSYIEALRNQAKAALYEHFKEHSGSVITPAEWNEAVVSVVLATQGATPTKALMDQLAVTEAQLEDARLFSKAEEDKAAMRGYTECLEKSLASLKSFSDSKDRLGPDDKKDVPGVLRAIEILSKELS